MPPKSRKLFAVYYMPDWQIQWEIRHREFRFLSKAVLVAIIAEMSGISKYRNNPGTYCDPQKFPLPSANLLSLHR